MDEERSRLMRQIVDLTEDLQHIVRPVLPLAWSTVDLTMSQLKVVLLLYSQGTAHMSRLATALGVSLPTATGIVDRLVERGLVMREEYPGDRRLVVIRLSEHGEGLILRVWEDFKLNLTDLLQTAEPHDLTVLAQGLDVIRRLATHRAAAAEEMPSPFPR